MSRRQPIPNGYQNRPGTGILPASYQTEPIPMMTGPGKPFQPIPMAPQYKRPSVAYSNSLKTNRIAPPPSLDYKTYTQSNHSFQSPLSIVSTNPLMKTSYKQPPMDQNYPNQPYYQQNNYSDVQLDDNTPEGNGKQTSWSSKPLCLGLTRLSGGILFGTMLFLALGSLGGLVASVVLYIQDMSTNAEWKILGMVVCAIMLFTVGLTLCIFIYCYKKGHIRNNNINNNNINNHNNHNNSLTPNYNQENDYRDPYNYNRSPAVPYGTMEDVTPSFTNEDIIHVQDKLTNTETTISPLRPKDIQRGVWTGNNAYDGISYRPVQPPKMFHRYIQASPTEIDRLSSKPRNQIVDTEPKTIIRIPEHRRGHGKERHSRRAIEPQSQYEMVNDITTKPRKRPPEEYGETIELPRKGKNKQRFNKVLVKHVKTIEQPQSVEDEDFNTDHFYQ